MKSTADTKSASSAQTSVPGVDSLMMSRVKKIIKLKQQQQAGLQQPGTQFHLVLDPQEIANDLRQQHKEYNRKSTPALKFAVERS